MSDITEQQLEDIEALFVQTAAGLTSEAGTIILHGPSPSTIYFGDRPHREVGHIATKLFIDLWDDGENSFADDPPNAVLSFADPTDRMPEEVILTINNPDLTGDGLRYDVAVLSGELPTTTGPCALFIDPIGRPLSPLSIAGVNRRDRRRDRRR